ncbi:Germin-like protein subfamily T member 1 [Acorus gramineus]|uniref:Germin-like protein n=1 Tax=Acorus gramineus TaxID=55184 RepID=A0AAV9A6Z0_ACOGR|nr:Germin-like protein subfamily T member 1 [Acorus gramineus]
MKLQIQTKPLVLFILFMALQAPPALYADPDPLQDFCIADLAMTSTPINGFPCKPASNVTASDFIFNGLAEEGNTTNPFGSNVTAANVLAFPGLNTLGVSMNRIDLAPGGLNTPHHHPRATELDIVVKGEVLIGFISSGNVYFSRVLREGQMFVIPKGMIHFEMNVGKEKGLIFAAFNSQLPGTVSTTMALFAAKPALPNEVLTKALQVDESVVELIKSKLTAASS